MNMIKAYISFQIFYRYRMLHSLIFLFFLQEFKHSLGRRRRHLQHVRNLCDLLDRLCKTFHILNKRLNISYFNCLSDRQKSSQNRNHHISEISDKLHDRHHHPGKKLRTPCGIIKPVIGCIKLTNHIFLFIEGFDDIMSTVDFFHLPIHISQIFLLSAEIFL